MANANSTSSRTSKRDAKPMKSMPVDVQERALAEDMQVYVFDNPIQRFPVEKMAMNSDLLERAGDRLSDAYATAGAIEAIAGIVRRSALAKENGDPTLPGNTEDHLMSAIELLSRGLGESLCGSADWFEKRLDEISKKGGAQ